MTGIVSVGVSDLCFVIAVGWHIASKRWRFPLILRLVCQLLRMRWLFLWHNANVKMKEIL